MAQGLETDAGSKDGRKPRFTPPTLESLIKLFPQLQILGVLGAGGMGAVYKARQPALDRIVALKILPADDSSGTNFAERFNREARALARLNHPNIVTVYEFGQVEGLHFFLMEFVDGANLRQLEKSGRLSPREALQIIPQICDALQYAHDEGVVHRDIKPENVLVDRKGRVKIADFGLAKILGQDVESLRLTNEGQVMGTPHYMAPEQVARPLAVDHRADIYSLGVVLYEMLTGELPLGKFAPPSRKVQVDVRLDDVVLRALENDPARRYQHASEVKTQVENITGAAAPAVAPTSTPLPAGPHKIYWAGIPVVVEQNGQRQVSYSGVMLALAAATIWLIASWLFLAFTTDNPHSNFFIPTVAALGIVFAGIRYTLRQPSLNSLPRTPQGTVILPPKRPWWRNGQYYALGSIAAFSVIWNVTVEHTFLFQKMFPRPLPMPAQLVQNNNGPLRASLPGGGTVELVAIGHSDSAPNQWWMPNGQLITDAAFELHNPTPIGQSKGEARRILVKHTGLPKDAEGPYFDIGPNMSFAAGGKVFVDGQPADNINQACFVWPASTSRAAVRIGYGLDPWRTVSSHDVANHRNTYTAQSNDPTWGITVHDATDGKDGAQITLVMGTRSSDWHTRVVAIDTEGKERTQHIMSSTPSGTRSIATYAFPGMSLKDIKEFRVQARLIHWVEFRDLTLNPTVPLPTTAGYRFVTITNTTSRPVDLDTVGDTTGLVKNGYEIIVGRGELQIHNTTFAVVKDEEWDQLSPQQVMDRVEQGRFAPKKLKPLNPDGTGCTFAYQTSENTFGLLQLVNLGSKSANATLRIKRIENPFAKRIVTKPAPPKEYKPVLATPEKLAELPKLRFLAWQDEWLTNKPNGSWHLDGSAANTKPELELLHNLDPVRCDAGETEAAKRNPKFLHLWISHPLFDSENHATLTLLTTNGQPIKLGADGHNAGTRHNLDDKSDGLSWYITTLSPGEGEQIPLQVDIKLDYALGPLEHIKEIPADYSGSMTLEANSQLNGLGQNSEGEAFIAISADTRKDSGRRFMVLAVTIDGKELAATGGERGGTVGAPFQVERFKFPVPVSQISHFKVGTRPIRTVEWKNVPLPRKGPQL